MQEKCHTSSLTGDDKRPRASLVHVLVAVFTYPLLLLPLHPLLLLLFLTTNTHTAAISFPPSFPLLHRPLLTSVKLEGCDCHRRMGAAGGGCMREIRLKNQRLTVDQIRHGGGASHLLLMLLMRRRRRRRRSRRRRRRRRRRSTGALVNKDGQRTRVPWSGDGG